MSGNTIRRFHVPKDTFISRRQSDELMARARNLTYSVVSKERLNELMGQIPVPPAPRYKGQTDKSYHAYLREYRAGLVDQLDRTPVVFRSGWSTLLIVAFVLVAVGFMILSTLTQAAR